MHKTIFTWFGNLPTSTELQGFHYYQGRIQNTKLRLQSFFSHIKNTATTQHKTLKPESRFHKNGLNGSKKKISRGRCPRTPRGLSMSALAGRNGNGLGTGWVSLYPNPTRGFDSEARTHPVY